MKNRLTVCTIFLLLHGSSIADPIKLYNQTEQDLYVAIYFEKNSQAEQATIPQLIKSSAVVELDRPSRRLLYDRELYVSSQAADLQKKLDEQNTARLLSVNVGDLQGNNFYIAEHDGKLAAYGLTITEGIKKKITDKFRAIRTNEYGNTRANVRLGNELHKQEKEYLQKRKPKVKAALEQLLGQKIGDAAVPTIALVESGGGYRAMTSSVGFHYGLTNAGIMDAVTYMVGLSGSTWSIALWLRSSLPIDKFQDQLFLKMEQSIENIDTSGLSMIATNFLVKKINDQDLTLVDIFGGLLANRLLSGSGAERQRTYLSDQAKIIEYGSLPFPIYTAVRGDSATQQEWFEFTPYEVGSAWLGAYVPTWAFGRKFKDNKSVDFAPEQALGYLLGTFGSAFAGTINQFIEQLKIKKTNLSAPMQKMFDVIVQEIGDRRLTAARLFNFTYGVSNSPLAQAAKINLVDAGLECNLPYPPVSGERAERKADIIIIMDASASVLQLPGAELKKVEKYVKDKGLKFPVIDYTDIEKHAVSIFKDENDAAVPLVIYLPLVNDVQLRAAAKKGDNKELSYFAQVLSDFDVQKCISKSYCSTFNFKYTQAQAKQLSGLMEFNVRANKQKLIDAIKWKTEQLGAKK